MIELIKDKTVEAATQEAKRLEQKLEDIKKAKDDARKASIQ